jgi:hypothetical protein
MIVGIDRNLKLPRHDSGNFHTLSPDQDNEVGLLAASVENKSNEKPRSAAEEACTDQRIESISIRSYSLNLSVSALFARSD